MRQVDVIIVTYQSAPFVGRCIGAARACPQTGRIVVVDNASSDGSAAAARAAGADVVLENRVNLGFARGVNQGLRCADADHILLLNPDAEMTVAALDGLQRALILDPGAVMAGPMLRTPAGRTTAGARRFSTVANRLLWHLPLFAGSQWSTPEYLHPPVSAGGRPVVPVDYLWGAALLCRRDFLEKTGGMDERFWLYSEDEDLGRQARLFDRRCLLVPDSVVVHVGGASTQDAALAQARVEVSTADLLRKWDGRAAGVVFLAAVGPVLAVRAALLAVAGRPGQARTALRTCALLPRVCRARPQVSARARRP